MTVAELPKEGSRNLGQKSWPDRAGRGDSASSTLELLCCRKYLLTALGANNIERERERRVGKALQKRDKDVSVSSSPPPIQYVSVVRD